MTKKDDFILVREMLDHARDAMTFSGQLSLDAFKKNRMAMAATIRSIQVIGEAASRLSSDFRESHTNIPWRQIIGTRNILVHRYFDLDDEAVWKIVKTSFHRLSASYKTSSQIKSRRTRGIPLTH